MPEQPLGSVLVVFGEANTQVRRTVSDSLRQHGYRNMRDTDRPEEIVAAIEQDQVDLLICDVALGDGDLPEVIRRLRNGEIGKNPFPVVVTLTEDSSSESIHRLVDCGADDIVLKPLSVGLLLERLEYLSRNRKGFVVTTDYVGPDRRKAPRPGTQVIPVLTVPNPLRHKVEGGDNETLRAEIEAASRIVNEQKLERHAFQIHYLVDKLVPQYQTGTPDAEVVPLVERLLYVSEDLVRRMAGTEWEGQVSDLGATMVEVASALNRSPLHPDMGDIRQLPQLGASLREAFVGEAPAPESIA